MADTKIQECSSPMYIDKMAEYSTTMKQTAQFKKWQEKLNRFFFHIINGLCQEAQI